MNHLILVQLLLSGGAGLVTFFLYYLYSFFNPSAKLSYFLGLQLCVVFIISLNIFHTYTLANIATNLVLIRKEGRIPRSLLRGSFFILVFTSAAPLCSWRSILLPS
jgi:hypothetical protein